MQSERPCILVSNDDGVDAAGIKALHSELSSIGNVTVVAPDRERSAASHSLTLQVPIRAHRLSENVISVDGTPTDCIMLAFKNLLESKPDIVVSGINRGANMGDDITYSGTVAAAMEATLLGAPAIAVSLERNSNGDYDYTAAARIAREISLEVLKRGLPDGILLNVNVPSLPSEKIRGIKITRLGKQVYEDLIIEQTDPRGKPYYWIGGQQETWSIEPNTDYTAVADGFVSITPIHLDLTDYRTFALLEGWELDSITEAAGGKTDRQGEDT